MKTLLVSVKKISYLVVMKALSIITALLLFIAVLELPYGYYTFLRIAVTTACIFHVVKEYELRNYFWWIPFLLIAILFNPLIPVHLYDKNKWMPIDIACGVLFLLKAFLPEWNNKSKKSQETLQR